MFIKLPDLDYISTNMSAKTQQQIDRTPFWGFKTVAELRFLSQVLNNKVQDVNLKKECFIDLLKGKDLNFRIVFILLKKA